MKKMKKTKFRTKISCKNALNVLCDFFDGALKYKKAQVTLFIIVGLVILSVSAVIINVNKDSVKTSIDTEFSKQTISSTGDIKTVRDYFEKIAQSSSLYLIDEFLQNGAILYDINGFDYNSLGIKYQKTAEIFDRNVSYYLLDYTNNDDLDNPWNLSNYPCFKKRLQTSCDISEVYSGIGLYGNRNYVADIRKLQNILNLKLQETINNSIDWDFIKERFRVKEPYEINVSVLFNRVVENSVDKSYVSIVVNYDVILFDSSGNEFLAGLFEISVPAKISTMYELGTDIVFNKHQSLLYNPKVGNLPNNYAGFKFNIIDNFNDAGDAIYEIIDERFRYFDKKNLTFRFAVRNRPPVLNWTKYPSRNYFYVLPGDNFTLQLFAIDPDYEEFWFEIKEVTPKLTTSITTADLFRQKAYFDSNGKMEINTTGMTGRLDFIACATDGADSDCQNLSLVVNDIPKVNFSMLNGFYWNEFLLVNSDSIYDKDYYGGYYDYTTSFYSFDDDFIPTSVDRFVGGATNPKLKLLYIPCYDGSGNIYEEDVIPKSEYVRLNASVIDVFDAGGYSYYWSYKCEIDHDSSFKPIHSCVSDVCYLGETFVNIECSVGSDIIIMLEVNDGISSGFANNTYKFESCLNCRECCNGKLMMSPGELPKYRPTRQNKDYADYSLDCEGSGRCVYMPDSSYKDPLFSYKDVFIGEVTDVYTSYTNAMNKLKYDTTSDTGVLQVDEEYINYNLNDRNNFYNLKSYSIGSNIFYTPFETSTGNFYFKKDIKGFLPLESLRPLKVCVINSKANLLTNYPVSNWYRDYNFEEVYQKAHLYFQPSCNGEFAFADYKNIMLSNVDVKPVRVLLIQENGLLMGLSQCENN